MVGDNLAISSLVSQALVIIYDFYRIWIDEVGRGDNEVEMVFPEKFIKREEFLLWASDLSIP